MQEMVANGPSRIQAYGAWMARRYRSRKNLVWMMGGDMGTPRSASSAPPAGFLRSLVDRFRHWMAGDEAETGSDLFDDAQTAVERALLTGIQSVAGRPSPQFSAEWTSASIATDQVAFGRAMTLNGAYSWTGGVNDVGRRAYAHLPVRPAFLLEEPYDEEGPDGNGVNERATQPVRRFQWWGWLSTIGGYIAGNGYVWPFRDWRAHLDTPGSRDSARLNAFVTSIAWHTLVPSGLAGMRTLVAGADGDVASSAYVAAAAAPDGSLLVAYVPPDHTGPVTVDMRAMAGPSRARWFDPTSGAYTAIGSNLPNTSPRTFSTPGNNRLGERDWVLALDVPSDPPGVPSAAADAHRHEPDAVGRQPVR